VRDLTEPSASPGLSFPAHPVPSRREPRNSAVRPGGGPVAILAGAAAWGSTGTAAHFAPAGASSVSIGSARIVLGGLVLLAIALWTAQGRRAAAALVTGSRAVRGSLVLAAAAVSGYQLCFFNAVRMTGVAIGTVVAIGSAPVFTGLLSRLTGGPALDRRWMLATAAAVAGCAVLVAGGGSAGVSAGGVLLALAAGFCYAIYAVAAARLISAGSQEATVMGLLFGGGAVLLAPVLVTSSPGWLLTARGLAVTGYLGIVTTVAAYLLYGRGLRTVSAPVAVTLGLAEPVVAAMLGLVVLGERLTPPAIAGLVLVGLALAALALGRRQGSATASPPVGPPG
jgi:drug/metabolite transporter, DME family